MPEGATARTMVMAIAGVGLVVIFLGAVGDGEGLYGNGE